MAYDLIINDAQIIDGTGAPAVGGSVAVQGDKIAAVGKVDGTAKRVIDAHGMTLAPGFIDIHTHMDAQLLWDPLATSSCWQGITTLVMGNCSYAIAPVRPRDRDSVLRTLVRVEGMSLQALEAGVDWSWETYPDYLDRIDRKLGLNVVALMGHSAIRQYVMGDDASERAARPEEIEAMTRVARAGLDAGAFGFSFNFISSHAGADGRPIPCRLAKYEEVLAVASQLKGSRQGAIQINDNANPAKDPIDSADDLARASGRPVWWLPLLQFYSQPGVWKQRLEHAAEKIAGGSLVRPMCSPRTIDVLFNLRNAHVFDGLPAWNAVLTKSPEEVKAALRRPEVRAAMQRDFDDKSRLIPLARSWDMVEVIEVRNEALRRFERRKISEIAAEQNRAGLDVFLDLSLEDDLNTDFLTVLANGDENAAGEMLRHPHTLIGLSDAGAHAALECGYGFTTHLLGHWVRERKLMPLEEAVRKLTSMLADSLGLQDRGRIRPGLAADLVLFDPASVNSLPPVAAFDFPAGTKRFIQKATGIDLTVVNGEILMEKGEHAGTYPGGVLRRR